MWWRFRPIVLFQVLNLWHPWMFRVNRDIDDVSDKSRPVTFSHFLVHFWPPPQKVSFRKFTPWQLYLPKVRILQPWPCLNSLLDILNKIIIGVKWETWKNNLIKETQVQRLFAKNLITIYLHYLSLVSWLQFVFPGMLYPVKNKSDRLHFQKCASQKQTNMLDVS